MATFRQIASLLERSFAKWDFQKGIKFSNNESETRDYLIEPFFEQLGYNKMEHYSHEFSLSFGKGKVKKVDMVVSLNGKKPIMLIECKKASENLNRNHFKQLAEYFENHKDSKVGILTNGIQYEFYSVRWDNDITLCDRPFLKFDLNDFTKADLEEISHFHIQLFDINNILSISEEKYFLDDFNEALVKTLFKPNLEFRKLVFQNMLEKNNSGKRMTDAISERIFNLINSVSIQEAIEKLKVLEGKESSSGIITSSQELKAFQIIKTIIALTPKLKNQANRVSYKDYKGQFKIIVDEMPSKEICNLVFNNKSKKLNIGSNSYDLTQISAENLAIHKKKIVEEAIIHLIN